NLLLGGRGNDQLVGNAGNDSTDGGLGSNDLHGGVGANLADYSQETATDFELSTAGSTLVIAKNGNGGGVDRFDGGAELRLRGSLLNDSFLGQLSVDAMVDGSDGDDTFHLGKTSGSLAKVTLMGGKGNDSFMVDASHSPAAILGNAGADTVASSTVQGF